MFTSWQDFVFATGGFLFALALVPTITHTSTRIPRKTSAINTIVIAAFAVAHASLGLPMACVTEAVVAGFWTFILLFRSTARPLSRKKLEALCPSQPRYVSGS